MNKSQNWKKISIRKLFSATNTGNILSRDVEDGSGVTPYVTASANNNGVMAHIDASKYEIIKGNCILVGGKTFTLTYQKDDFVSNDSHNFVLRLFDNRCDLIHLFLITSIKASLREKYAWSDAVTKEKLLGEYIYLPINSKGNIDWDYMELAIKNLSQRANRTLDEFQIVDSYKKESIDINKFKRFPLYYKDLFTIDSGTKLDKIKMTKKNPKVNFIGRANANNGVTDYIDLIDGLEPYKAGNLTISLGGEYLGSCFIQDKDFYTSQNVNVLIPNHKMSDNCKHYIAAIVFKEGRLHYKAFIDELNRHMKTDFTIPLPVENNGSIDWDFMDNYIEIIRKKSIHTIKTLTSDIFTSPLIIES